MRTLLITILVFLGMAASAPAETIHVGVDGLVCAFCAKGIENGFKKHEAIEGAQVDMDKKLVTLTTKTDQSIDDAAIKKIVTDVGYNATSIHRQK